MMAFGPADCASAFGDAILSLSDPGASSVINLPILLVLHVTKRQPRQRCEPRVCGPCFASSSPGAQGSSSGISVRTHAYLVPAAAFLASHVFSGLPSGFITRLDFFVKTRAIN